jgi:hypothetical protein
MFAGAGLIRCRMCDERVAQEKYEEMHGRNPVEQLIHTQIQRGYNLGVPATRSPIQIRFLFNFQIFAYFLFSFQTVQRLVRQPDLYKMRSLSSFFSRMSRHIFFRSLHFTAFISTISHARGPFFAFGIHYFFHSVTQLLPLTNALLSFEKEMRRIGLLTNKVFFF